MIAAFAVCVCVFFFLRTLFVSESLERMISILSLGIPDSVSTGLLLKQRLTRISCTCPVRAFAVSPQMSKSEGRVLLPPHVEPRAYAISIAPNLVDFTYTGTETIAVTVCMQGRRESSATDLCSLYFSMIEH